MEPTVKGRKLIFKINDLEHKKEINIQPEQKKETRKKKNKDRIRRLWNISKHPNIKIIVEPDEKRKSNKLKTYLNK